MSTFGFKETIDWYNANAAQYADATEHTFSLDQIDEFVSLLPKDGRVLDAGCGAGRDTHLLAERGLSVVGLDLSHGLLEEAKKRYPACEFREGSFLGIPYENSMFDGIWAQASLVHLETIRDVEKAMSEFGRVLKVGGILHVL